MPPLTPPLTRDERVATAPPDKSRTEVSRRASNQLGDACYRGSTPHLARATNPHRRGLRPSAAPEAEFANRVSRNNPRKVCFW